MVLWHTRRKAGLNDDKNRGCWPECFGHGVAQVPSGRFFSADVDNPDVEKPASPSPPPRSFSRTPSPAPSISEQLEESGDDDDVWSVTDVSPKQIQREVAKRDSFTFLTIRDFYY